MKHHRLNKILRRLFCTLPFFSLSRLLVADDSATAGRQRMVADQIERRGVRNLEGAWRMSSTRSRCCPHRAGMT